jgi:hypothetical protein
MIRENLDGPRSEIELEENTNDPGAQYNMGKSQKFPVHIPTFLQRNGGDPAIKVNCFCSLLPEPTHTPLQNFFSKLRDHLLPRVQTALQQEAESLPQHPSVSAASDAGSPVSLYGNAHDFVFFKKDCIYHHRLLRFHFTTYDVRRGTDIVNAGTSRCTVMLLADHADDSAGSSQRFLYARILGAYHVNVVYTGPGMRDYEARRFDFLWVRWFEVVEPASSGWGNSTLDSVRFPPMHHNNSFGFVDPADVLRGCHILPAFAKGKRQANGVSVSRCAKDGKDYKLYYVGRYVQG